MSFPDTLSQSSLLDGECSHCALSGTEVHASRDTTAPPSGRSSCVDTFRETSPVNAEAEDPWLGCEELAREDLLAFLSDYARRRNHADSDAWAVEALRLDALGEDVDAFWVDEGSPWDHAAKYLASTPAAVARLRGWGNDQSFDRNSSGASETTTRLQSSGSRSAASMSSGASHFSEAPRISLLPMAGQRTFADRPLKGWGSPSSRPIPRGWEPVPETGQQRKSNANFAT
mmetsp:Transcript_52907/g.115470  ORF Transcript_52907/g.115470 Transcript_52907/m.115470 type:complete len:230 (+) Transcript_52907:90-779(+)